MSRPGRPTKARPRILVVGSQWPPQTFLHRLLTGLSDEFEVRVATREPLGEQGKLKRTALPSESWPRPWRAAFTAFAGAPALTRPAGRQLLKADGWTRLPYLRHAVDLLYFPWNSGAVDHLPLLSLGLPSIVSCRGSQVQVAPWQPERQALTAALPATFEAATKVHCVSRATCEAATAQGLDPAKARVIPPAVDTKTFIPTKTPSAPPWRLIAVGSLIWLKGFEDTLVALRHLLDEGHDVHLDLVGEGPDRQRLRFAINDLNLEGRVKLHGNQPPETVRKLLQNAHLFVLSSYSEGISNAVLEAMATGLPVVSTRCGGMEEAINDGIEGMLVPLHAPEALAAAISRLLKDPELRHHLGNNARRRVVRDFDLSDQIRAFADLCGEALT